MKVHLHTVAWNDRRMLEFFFAHYSPWVSHFFIHDDGSDDGTNEFLAARSDVTVIPLKRIHPDSWVLSAKNIYDTSWHSSCGHSDWVVVTNIDEHLHHPDMPTYLATQHASGVTAIAALGYQMLSEDWPESASLLWRDRPMGAPWKQMSKLQFFRPDQINRTDFAPGRHTVELEGNVKLPPTDEVTNLHYKYMDVALVQARHEAQRDRLGSFDRVKGWGHKYSWDFGALDADFETFKRALVDTRNRDHHGLHNEPRWWRKNGDNSNT
ncbi:MAG: glycosyltransferase family 2 protein [Pseudoruegeria sp.]